MKLALQVKTTGEVVELDLTANSLQTLQTAVGGWVQAIDITDSQTMWLNEEGKLISLPHNPFAQYIWDATFGAHTDYMVGDAVFTGGTDEEGATLGLDDKTAQELRTMIAKVSKIISPMVEVI